jgi:multicomponent Na+:H+ antiporter subunit A
LLGFVTKEAAYDLLVADGAWFVLGIVGVASAVTVAYSLRFWMGAFAVDPAAGEHAHHLRIAPVLGVPPMILAGASVVLGLFPVWLGEAVATAVGDSLKLLLWPGWKTALFVSIVVVAAGIGLHLWLLRNAALRSAWDRARLGLPSGSDVYVATLRGLNRIADGVTGVVQNGSLPVYLAVILVTVLSVPAAAWLLDATSLAGATVTNSATEIALAAIIITAAVVCIRVQRRMAAALLLGVVGYAVAGIYVTFGAPDLALTQVLIETFTVALFAFVLSRLPRRFGADYGSLSQRVRVLVALFAGLFVTGAALIQSSVEHSRLVAEFYSENALAAGGRNVVNVILTDFRALDTFGEITVLVTAAIGVGALVRLGGRRRTMEVDD